MTALPLSHVAVSGTFLAPDGAPRKGTVLATPEISLALADADLLVPRKTIRTDLDYSGRFALDLPATDDPRAGATGWTWHIQVRLDGFPEVRQEWNLTLPASLVSLDLADVSEAGSPSLGESLAIVPLHTDGTGTAPTSLDDLEDVAVPAPTTGDVLTFDGASWTPSAPEAAPASLDDLTDVAVPAPTTGDVLTFKAGAWTSAPVPASSGGGSSAPAIGVPVPLSPLTATGLTGTYAPLATPLYEGDPAWPTDLSTVLGWSGMGVRLLSGAFSSSGNSTQETQQVAVRFRVNVVPGEYALEYLWASPAYEGTPRTYLDDVPGAGMRPPNANADGLILADDRHTVTATGIVDLVMAFRQPASAWADARIEVGPVYLTRLS